MSNHQSWLEIDLKALKENFNKIKAQIYPAKLMPVVKANAYGHGAKEISTYLEKEKLVDYLAVAYQQEAIELRKSGIKTPILVLGSLNQAQIEDCLKKEIEVTVSSKSKFEILKKLSLLDKNKIIKFQLEINTGMNRGGIEIAEVLDFLEELFSKQTSELRNLMIKGIYTHLACDYQNQFTNQVQLKDFQELIKKIKTRYKLNLEKDQTIFHAIASPNLFNQKENFLDFARVGLSLYGLGENINKLNLKPVLSLKARITLIRKIPAKSFVSYNLTWQAQKDSLIGVLPLGYADGVNRALSNKVQFLYQDQLIPQIGTICMDQMMVDLSDLSSQPKEGDLVTLIGSNKFGAKEILVKDWSEILKTIDYEVTCSLGNSRLEKVFK